MPPPRQNTPSGSLQNTAAREGFPPGLRIRGLCVGAGNFSLREVDLDIAAGEYFVLLGPTGAGKTVFLETIAGLRRPSRGQIHLAGRDVTS
ncbi:MAG: ATP-binding cassette domain-containing protein, partial [Thermoflexia bacterium]